MRLPLILTVAALALSGCVVQNPGMAPVPAPLPPVTTPAPDAAASSSARVVINREMAKRLPGANVAPYTDCVIQNATSAELASIAAAGAAGAGIRSPPSSAGPRRRNVSPAPPQRQKALRDEPARSAHGAWSCPGTAGAGRLCDRADSCRTGRACLP
ncbi:hypothetical protein ACFSS8_09130 [Paracoccus kondratievae]